jgi:hypothetical protein
VRYWYALTPFVIVGTLVLLACPWLALIALMLVALVPLAALVWAIVAVSQLVGRAITGHEHAGSGASPQTAASISPASSRPRSVPAGAAVLLASPPSKTERVS